MRQQQLELLCVLAAHLARWAPVGGQFISTVGGSGANAGRGTWPIDGLPYYGVCAGYPGTENGAQIASRDLCEPMGTTFWNGSLYFAESGYSVIHRVDVASGTSVIVAGSGTNAFTYTVGCEVFPSVGDGSAATSVMLQLPTDVAVDDQSGDLIIADWCNHRVRKVSATTQMISTVAGSGTACDYNSMYDTGPATLVSLCYPTTVTLGLVRGSSSKTLFITQQSYGVRMVQNGVISTAVLSCDGIALSWYTLSTAVDGHGSLYIADNKLCMICAWSPNVGTTDATRVVGSPVDQYGRGNCGVWGDGGPATSAGLKDPWTLSFDASGNLYFLDYSSNSGLLRRVDAVSTIITTIAGNDSPPTSMEFNYTPALSAAVNMEGLASDGMNSVYITDPLFQRIYEVFWFPMPSPSVSASSTATLTLAASASTTATHTTTRSHTPTRTPSQSSTFSTTPSSAQTPSKTPSMTMSPSRSHTQTRTASITSTKSNGAPPSQTNTPSTSVSRTPWPTGCETDVTQLSVYGYPTDADTTGFCQGERRDSDDFVYAWWSVFESGSNSSYFYGSATFTFWMPPGRDSMSARLLFYPGMACTAESEFVLNVDVNGVPVGSAVLEPWCQCLFPSAIITGTPYSMNIDASALLSGEENFMHFTVAPPASETRTYSGTSSPLPGDSNWMSFVAVPSMNGAVVQINVTQASRDVSTCHNDPLSPSARPTTSTSTNTASSSRSPSRSPPPSRTSSPTSSLSRTRSKSATSSASPTRSATPSASLTQSSTPSASLTRSATPSASPTRSATPSTSFTQSATPSWRSSMASVSASMSLSCSISARATTTAMASMSLKVSFSGTASASVSRSFSGTASASVSRSFSGTASASVSRSFSGTASASVSRSFSGTASASVSRSFSDSASASVSRSFSRMASASTTYTPTVSSSGSPSLSISRTTSNSRTGTPSAPLTGTPFLSHTRTSTPSRSFSTSESSSSSPAGTSSSSTSVLPIPTHTPSPSYSRTPSTSQTTSYSSLPSPLSSSSSSSSSAFTPSSVLARTPSVSAQFSATLYVSMTSTAYASSSATITSSVTPASAMTATASSSRSLAPSLSSGSTHAVTASATSSASLSCTPTSTSDSSRSGAASLSSSGSPSVSDTASTSVSSMFSRIPTSTETLSEASSSSAPSSSSSLSATPVWAFVSISGSPSGSIMVDTIGGEGTGGLPTAGYVLSTTSAYPSTSSAVPSSSSVGEATASSIALSSESTFPSPLASVSLRVSESTFPSPLASVSLRVSESTSPSPLASVSLRVSVTAAASGSPSSSASNVPSAYRVWEAPQVVSNVTNSSNLTAGVEGFNAVDAGALSQASYAGGVTAGIVVLLLLLLLAGCLRVFYACRRREALTSSAPVGVSSFSSKTGTRVRLPEYQLSRIRALLPPSSSASSSHASTPRDSARSDSPPRQWTDVEAPSPLLRVDEILELASDGTAPAPFSSLGGQAAASPPRVAVALASFCKIDLHSSGSVPMGGEEVLARSQSTHGASVLPPESADASPLSTAVDADGARVAAVLVADLQEVERVNSHRTPLVVLSESVNLTPCSLVSGRTQLQHGERAVSVKFSGPQFELPAALRSSFKLRHIPHRATSDADVGSEDVKSMQVCAVPAPELMAASGVTFQVDNPMRMQPPRGERVGYVEALDLEAAFAYVGGHRVRRDKRLR